MEGVREVGGREGEVEGLREVKGGSEEVEGRGRGREGEKRWEGIMINVFSSLLVLEVQHLQLIPLLHLCHSSPIVLVTLGGQEPPGGQWVRWNHRDQWGLGRRAEGGGG